MTTRVLWLLWAVGGRTSEVIRVPALSPSCTSRLFLSILLHQAGDPTCKLWAGITFFSSLCSSHTSAHPGLFFFLPALFLLCRSRRTGASGTNELQAVTLSPRILALPTIGQSPSKRFKHSVVHHFPSVSKDQLGLFSV